MDKEHHREKENTNLSFWVELSSSLATWGQQNKTPNLSAHKIVLDNLSETVSDEDAEQHLKSQGVVFAVTS